MVRQRLAKLREITAKGELPEPVDTDWPIPVAEKKPRYHHMREVNRRRAEYERQLREQEAAALKRAEQEALEREALFEEHVKRCWQKLIRSKKFRINANHDWLHFDRFIEDVGMPDNDQRTLYKDPRHISYTKFSVRWV